MRSGEDKIMRSGGDKIMWSEEDKTVAEMHGGCLLDMF